MFTPNKVSLLDFVCVVQAGIYDEAMSSFFRNVDTRYSGQSDIPVGDACGKIRSLKARVCWILKKYLNCLCAYCSLNCSFIII